MMSQENVRLSVAFGLAILLASFYAPSLRGQIVPPPLFQAGPAEETDIYIVTFRQGTTGSQRAAAAQGAGAVLRFNYNVVNAISVQVPNGAVLTRLQNDPRVVAVFANLSISLHASQVQVQAKGGNPGGGGGKGGGGGGGNPRKPAAPRNLSATAVSSSGINLTWQDKSDNEDGFRIERCTGSGCGGFVQVAQVGANVTSYSDLGLTPETSYRYRVRAVNPGGNSRYSNIAEAITDPESSPAPPAVPTILNATAVSYRQINLDWGDNSDNEDGFRIERCTGSGCGDFLQVAQVGANVTSYSDLGLTPETSCSYRVRAFANAGGNSPYSNIAEATTQADPASSQVVPSGVERIDAPLSWAASWTGQGVGVAIVDTGLDFNHLDLDLNSEVEGINSFNAFGGSCQDDYGHGTHVGGIVAARHNTIDVVGVAPDATLYCVKVFSLDPIFGPIATDESLIAGLDWIATNANQVSPPIRVVNMSLGRSKTPQDNPNHPLHVAVKALYDSGISVVVSAGNQPLT